MPMNAFISYSNQDRVIAGQVKTYLEGYNISAFLAHEDINVTEVWRERILQELAQTTVFIPLLSVAFKESDWASQEIGFALGRNVLIIPISLDGTIPYGFLAAVQGGRIPGNGDYHALLIGPIINNLPHEIFPVLIERLSHAGSYRNAEALMQPLVPHFANFNDTEIESFVDACSGNGQVWDAGDNKLRYIPIFIGMHSARIPPAKLDRLTRLIQH